ncbi:TolC family protein [bacterium]|nr:TolC family protein [bacterium]
MKLFINPRLFKFLVHFLTCGLLFCILTGCIGGRIGQDSISGELNSDQLFKVQGIDLESLSEVAPKPVEDNNLENSLELNDNAAHENSAKSVSPDNEKDSEQDAPEQISANDSTILSNQKENNVQSMSLTLEDARSMALENNLDVSVSVIQPAIAAKNVAIEQARFDATFSNSVSWSDNFKDGTMGGFYDVQPSLSQALPGGGNVGISGGGTSLLYDNQTQTKAYQDQIGLNVSQPLLRGFGLRTSTAPIRIARLEQQASESQAKLNIIQTLASLEVAYWEVEASRGELLVQERQLNVAELQLSNVEKLIKNGIVTRVERNRAISGMLARRENVVVAETNLRLSERKLKQIINSSILPVESKTHILCETKWQPMRIKLDPSKLMGIAVTNRMELATLQVQLTVNEINTKLAKNGLLPQLDLALSYVRQGQALKERAAFDNIFRPQRSLDDYTIGATVTFPLGNRAARARSDQAKLERLRLLASKDRTELLIRKEIYDSVDQLERDWQRIIAANAAAKSAELTYEAELDQFLQGVRTSTEVLEAASNWAFAESRKVRALADYAISKVYIALATGTMLGFSQVEWQPTTLQN